MSSKEHERGVVLSRVEAGELTLKEGAELLGLSYRQAKRLARRYREEGRGGLVHGNVGQRSNRSRDARERERVLKLIAEQYSGQAKRGPGQRFGPSLVAEQLEEEHAIVIPRTTLRDWMLEAGQWSRIRRSRPRPRRRERRKHFGELVQMDGSFHDWFEGRGERAGARSCVMNMVDDATGCTLLRFGEQETIWTAAAVLREWITRYGVPRALYTDWKNVYKREPTDRERRLGLGARTHFGLMCQKLGIQIIGASSPQAKGRVERSNGVHQDRLIKKLRRLGISDDAAANAYGKETYLPQHNARFTVPAGSTVDYHLPLDPAVNPADIFCLEYARVVGNDYVIQFEGKELQLERSARGRVPAGSKVLVRQTEDGGLRVLYARVKGEETECRWTPAAPRAARTPARKPTEPVERKAPQPRRPAADHPWRRPMREGAAAAARRAKQLSAVS
jgi:transposase